MSSRNWASGVEKLEKSEESEAGKAASRNSSLAGARILGALGSHVQPTPGGRARPRGSTARQRAESESDTVPGLPDSPQLGGALYRAIPAAPTPPLAAARSSR